MIYNGISYFESKLKQEYPLLNKEKAYFKFIRDWSNKELPDNFFKDDSLDSIHKQIRALEIWNESIRLDVNMKREAKLFNIDSMDPVRIKLDKNFSNCIIKSTECEGIILFLFDNVKYRLSPKLAQKRLFKISEFDLMDYENRMAITLGTYYQTIFNIN